MVVGHSHILTKLPVMSRVTMFVGPPSVGKFTTAWEIAEIMAQSQGAETLVTDKLTVESARNILDFSNIAPTHNARINIVKLDGATTAAMNMLLELIEELPRKVIFIFIATEFPIQSFGSRCEMYLFPLLTEEQVKEILVSRGFSDGQADKMAKVSGGQVKKALDSLNHAEAKSPVLAVLNAFRTDNPVALDKVADSWTDENTQLLMEWATERITERWRIFSDAETGEISRSIALRILSALSADVRPRLVIRSSLMNILQGA